MKLMHQFTVHCQNMHQIGKLPLLEMQYKVVQKYEHFYFLAGVILIN